jgi:protein-S-isoprenylcysteine O-methyltransferase Ste14
MDSENTFSRNSFSGVPATVASEFKPTRLLPPTYLLASIVLMLTLHQFLPLRRIIEPPWTRLGAVPIVLGFAIVCVCAWQFRRRQTTLKPFEESAALVEAGCYRFSRNPIYVSMGMILVGVAWLLGTVTPWVVVPLFLAAIAQQFISREEAMLAEKFGERYEQYRRRVRRWL